MVCGKCKKNNTNIVCYCNSCFQNARLKARQEGRVEGAKERLENELVFLKNTLNLKFKKFKDINLMGRIDDIKKRLKELEEGVE